MARNMELSFMLNPSLAGSSQVSRRIPIPQPRRSLCTVRPMSCCVRSHCNTPFCDCAAARFWDARAVWLGQVGSRALDELARQYEPASLRHAPHEPPYRTSAVAARR